MVLLMSRGEIDTFCPSFFNSLCWRIVPADAKRLGISTIYFFRIRRGFIRRETSTLCNLIKHPQIYNFFNGRAKVLFPSSPDMFFAPSGRLQNTIKVYFWNLYRFQVREFFLDTADKRYEKNCKKMASTCKNRVNFAMSCVFFFANTMKLSWNAPQIFVWFSPAPIATFPPGTLLSWINGAWACGSF